MSTIVLRSVVNRALTSTEIDANFDNLNTGKVETTAPVFSGLVTLPSQIVALTDSNLPDVAPSLNLDFANSKQLDPRITFVRNSTAAYYDGQTTAMAEQNLLIGSQTIGGTGWVLGSNIVTLNSTTAPDNTTTASSITENATVNSHFIGAAAVTVTIGLPYTFSVYLKKGVGATAPQYMQFYAFSAAFNCGINVDLNAGTINSTVSVGATVSASSSVSMGNGWYRFIFTATALSSSTSGNIPAVVFINNNPALGVAPSYLGLVTSDVQAWGAQLEQRSSATAYTPTTTSPITNYIPVLMTAPAGVARFDCDPITGKSLGLLIEESRTNLLTYSSDFSNAVWTKGAAVLYYNQLIAPDGTLTATLIGTTSSVLPYYYGINWVSGLSYTYSIFVKPVTGTTIGFRMNSMDSVGDQKWTFNSTTGVITKNTGIATATSTVTNIGNSWYRLSFTSTANQSATGYVSFEAGTGFAVWGAQLEAGSFATSYIPTPSNATVTRQPDVAYMSGTNFSSWYNQSQGTLYDEVDFYSGSNEHSFSLIGPSYTNFGITNIKTDSTHRAYDVYANPDVYVGRQSFNYSPSQKYKEVVAYTNTYYISSMNGVISSPTYGNITANNATRLLLGQYFFSLTMCGHIKKLTYYPKALSAPQLQGLTK